RWRSDGGRHREPASVLARIACGRRGVRRKGQRTKGLMDPAKLVPPKALVPLVSVLGLISLTLIYGKRLNYPPIRSDGMGYYLYLPASLIDHDLTLQRTIARSFGGTSPEWAGVNRIRETNRLLIKYPPGEAIMLAPSFLLA